MVTNAALQMNVGNQIFNASSVYFFLLFFFRGLGWLPKDTKGHFVFLGRPASYLWASMLVDCLVFHYPLSGLQHHGECFHSPVWGTPHLRFE